MRVIELQEEEPRLIREEELGAARVLELHREYGSQFEIIFPGPLLGDYYRLRSRGYAGWFPLGRDCQIHVRPKVGVRNLFGMLEWAYQFHRFRLWESGVVETETVDGLCEFLASVLARRVIDRVRRGLWRDFEERTDVLSCVRGRVLPAPTQQGRNPYLLCRFAEQTADLVDNRILAWTLFRIRRYPFRREKVRRLVNKAFFRVAGGVDLIPVEPEECVGRDYHRLNRDYQLLHALCRLFLEQSGPAVGHGERTSMGFAVYMPGLFEMAVAEWLKHHLPPEWELAIQHRAPIEGSEKMAFQIDLALRERSSGKHLAVLDTKYKREPEPEEGDIQQVVAYAVRMGVKRAVLIYPHAKTRTRFLRVGSVEVRMLAFDLERDIDRAGSQLVDELMDCVEGEV